MIELPKTIRPAEEHEIPKDSTAFERFQLLSTAKIVEGYRIADDSTRTPELTKVPFNFYAEINCNNSRLWSVLMSLSNELPDVVSLIFGHADGDVAFSEYLSKNLILERINSFEIELTQDAFIQWGLNYSDEENLVELFVDESKYVKFWGVDLTSFKAVMDKNDLKEIADLEFIDEYPKVREPLTKFKKECLSSEKLINELRKM